MADYLPPTADNICVWDAEGNVVDSGIAIGSVGGSITVQDDGTPLSTAATTLNFAGTGVAATGTGSTKTITINSGSFDGVVRGLKPASNSTTAIQITQADGTTPVLVVDTTNKYVGVGSTPVAPLQALKGASSINSALYNSSSVQINGGQDISSQTDLVVADNTATAGYRGTVRGVRSRGSLSAPAAVVSGDFVASMTAGAFDGGTVRNTGHASFIVDGTVGTNQVPQRWGLFLSTNGADGATEKLTVKNSGRVGIATTAPDEMLHVVGNVKATTFIGGLTGNADTASTAAALTTNPSDCSTNQYATAIAANGNLTCAQPTMANISNLPTLASGTYIPTAANNTNTDAITPRVAQYLRVGNTVTISGSVSVDATNSGSASNATFTLTLPTGLESNFADFWDCAGYASSAQNTGHVRADTTNILPFFVF